MKLHFSKFIFCLFNHKDSFLFFFFWLDSQLLAMFADMGNSVGDVFFFIVYFQLSLKSFTLQLP